MEELFRSGFSMGNLYTTAADWQLVVPKKQSKAASLTKGRAAQTQAPSLDHNRAKNTNVSRDAPFMKALGLVGETTDAALLLYRPALSIRSTGCHPLGYSPFQTCPPL